MTVRNYHHIHEFIEAIEPEASLNSPLFHIISLQDDDLLLKKMMIPYRQNFFEISYTEGGDFDCYLDDRRINQQENALLFVSPGQINSLEMKSSDKPAEGYMVYFKPELLGAGELSCEVFKAFRFFNLNTLPLYYLKSDQKKIFTDLFQRMYDEFIHFREGSIEIITSYLIILLNEANRNLEPQFGENENTNRAGEITFQFENLIKSKHRKRLNLQQYAKELYISPSYLREAVKKATGKPAYKLIQEYQLLEAKSLLLQTTKTIKQVSLELGFEDASNFNKFFRNQAGVTPLQFRENPHFLP